MAIGRIVSEHPKPVRLLLLGPHTNLALAIRMKPFLSTNIESVVFMGGAHSARGNAYDTTTWKIVNYVRAWFMRTYCDCVAGLQQQSSIF